MSDKELYLHIGTHKTGTSALQQFFAANRKRLGRQGIIYPYDRGGGGGEAGHFRLWWSLQAVRGKGDDRYPADLGSSEQEWQAVLSQSGNGRLLISAEGLWNCKPEDIAKIKTMTADFPVTIVVYLRRQDLLAASVYNQLAKTRGQAMTDYKPSQYALNYADMLQRWSAAFGKEKVLVRPYERGQFYKNSIFADFMHHVFDLEVPADYTIPQGNVNARLHRIAFEYKQCINFLPMSVDLKRSTLEPLMSVSDVFYREGRADASLFSPRDQLELLGQYTGVNETIAREYLGRADGRLFYDPLPDDNGQWRPCEGLSPADARLINEHLMQHHPYVLYRVIDGLIESLATEDIAVKAAVERLLPGLLESSVDNGQRRMELERLRSKLAAGCRLQRCLDRLKPHIPGPLLKPARIVVRKFRKKSRA